MASRFEQMLDELPENPMEAAKVLAELVETTSGPSELLFDWHDEFVDAFIGFVAYLDAAGISHQTPPDLTQDRRGNYMTVSKFLFEFRQRLDVHRLQTSITQSREKYRVRFGTIFVYEFSDGDLKRIQVLINELRDFLTESECFTANHKERLLKKLEALQKELHKKMPSIDKLWGLVGDAGVAMGKLGRDAKPLVDRVKEILQIIWRTQARAEELPSATPLPLLSSEKQQDA